MLVFGGWLAGCSVQTVVWDATGGQDTVEDVAVAFLLFGTQEADREDLVGPHVAGGTLSIHATGRNGGGSAGWTASTLEPDIASVEVSPEAPDGIRVDLTFHRAGATDLFVFDEAGTVIDAQPLRVHEPAELRLLPWDDLSIEQDEPLGETVHLVPDTVTSLAVSWRDATGAVLLGGDLLSLDAAEATTGVTLDAAFTGEVDVVDVTTSASASPAVFGFTLSAPTVTFEREMRVHDRGDVDRIALVSVALDDGVRGLVHAEVFAGDDRMAGAAVGFSFEDRDPKIGTLLEWSTEEGPATTVTACFDAICDTIDVPGRPVEVTSPSAVLDGVCGCQSSPRLGAIGMMLAGLLVRRRR